MAEAGKSHFLNTHRDVLIKDVSEVASTLDTLLDKDLLTMEQYNEIDVETITQKKMRTLLDYSRGWSESDKEEFCYILRDKNRKVAVFQHWEPIGGDKKTSSSSSPAVYPPSGKASKYTDVLEVECSGATKETASINGLDGLAGEEASHAMAERDAEVILGLKDTIVRVGERKGIDPSLIAALISRLSNAGAQLIDGWGDDRECFGLMQVSNEWHTPRGEWNSEEHIDQGAEILVTMIGHVQGDFPLWIPAWLLKGATAAYMCGPMEVRGYKNVDRNTEGKDFSNDVMARAQWFKKNVFNG